MFIFRIDIRNVIGLWPKQNLFMLLMLCYDCENGSREILEALGQNRSMRPTACWVGMVGGLETLEEIDKRGRG